MSTQPATVCLRERFILIAALSFVTMTLLAGPLRMYLSTLGLSPLIYVPNLLMLLATGWQLLVAPRYEGFSALNLIALVLPAFALVIGLQYLPPVQTAMGVYVLLPFWFGLACGPVLLRHWRSAQRLVPLFWVVAAGGIFANVVVEFPWEGFNYNVGDLDVEGSRQWYAGGGIKRLAGFSRASFDAAVQVQLLGIMLVLRIGNPLVRSLVWVLTVVAIFPTNSKGILAVAMVLTPVALFRDGLPESPLRALPAVFGVIGLALPLSTLAFTFDSQLRNPTLANATHSFYDRLNYMWPEAWKLLDQHGSFLLGRGLGGIGTAQTYFESSYFNAGDNIFMYWFVVFGWAALPGFVLLLLRTMRIRPCSSPDQMFVYCLVLATLVYGTMTNIVENAIFGLVSGMVIRWLASSPVRGRGVITAQSEAACV